MTKDEGRKTSVGRSSFVFRRPKHMQQLNTARGIITIKIASAKEIEQLKIDAGLGFFWHNRPDLQHAALVKIARQPRGRVSASRAHTANRVIVGYVTVTYPDPDERWGKDHIEDLFELGGIEVGRTWRSFGIGRALMAELFSNGEYDKAIVLATGYRWCWDYESSGMTVREYPRRVASDDATFRFSIL